MKNLDSLSNSWQTPDWLFKELDEEFNFDIDLCATKENSKCHVFGKDYLNNTYVYTRSNQHECNGGYYDCSYDGYNLDVDNLCGKCKGKGYSELSGPSFPSCILIFDRRDLY